MNKYCRICVRNLLEPSRMKIYQFVQKSPNLQVTVGALVSLTKLRQPTVTFHVNKLAEAGLLQKKKLGRQVIIQTGYMPKHCSTCPIFR
ncbi:hypothetical protein A3D03_04945 [Candidatus Gottesmanbacteria bacterium RIFCSPHIGHO2_02_FULL_40_13]|uniref:HTH arsR-type domain-containing protein n=1 Tax=Candidatus Gottesmanbacteria bacterium RIFCSPHIGHO2_02_FULL_40_13 TaxID=1798384 RepID=A0A1F6AAX0_9BACT|nr:MAG: hypothetical protein A3D03_04945 [Candidatus Gottesmanbacteria bacterium RIFCSPHIGHO2_02_FULL_40_13]